MIAFAELTDLEGNPILINIDTITCIRVDGDHVAVFFMDGHWASVKETSEQVLHAIRVAS